MSNDNRSPFARRAPEGFIEKIKTTEWLRQYLDATDLFFALRDGYANMYYKGNSLLKINPGSGQNVNVETHYKYLLDPDHQATVSWDKIPSRLTLPVINPKADGSLKKLMKASDNYSGDEKEGVHEIIGKNSDRVVDVEIAFSSGKERVDLCALLDRGGSIHLKFYECKHFSNNAIRAQRTPKVVGQIQCYGETIAARKEEIQAAYEHAFEALIQISHPAKDIMQTALKSGFDIDPEVCLVIFGFDQPQRNTFRESHYKKLVDTLGESNVLMKGKPKDIRLE